MSVEDIPAAKGDQGGRYYLSGGGGSGRPDMGGSGGGTSISHPEDGSGS